MKILHRLLATFSIVTVSTFLPGCLKDTKFDSGMIQAVRTAGTQKIIEIGLTSSSTNNFQFLSLQASSNDTTLNLIPVVLASALAAPQDVHVLLKLDQAVLDKYNSANNSNYTLPSPAIYSLPNAGAVIIPGGSNTGYLQVKFKSNNFLSGGLAFAFSIVNADAGYTVSGNINTGIVAIGVKNKYDGVYSLRIKTVGWGAYGIADGVTGNWPAGSDGVSSIGMVTSGATTVTLYDYFRSDALQPAFTSTLEPTALGAATPQFTFDPGTDKLINVNNTTPDDGRGRSFRLNTAVTTSRFDPSSKTIFAAYTMTQNGRPDQQIYDTLGYIRPR